MPLNSGPWAYPTRKRRARISPLLITALGTMIATGLIVLIAGSW